ncbi:MAG TPA: DUF4404 family protein [Prosthecobacter sp.]|nr:DUF4404 family protein [Prosthecobacter sp.]
MIEDHIQQLRNKLADASGLPEGTRAELLGLVEALEREAVRGDAGSQAADTEESEPPALGKLVSSVEELEASHPELVASINQVASVLGKMGI